MLTDFLVDSDSIQCALLLCVGFLTMCAAFVGFSAGRYLPYLHNHPASLYVAIGVTSFFAIAVCFSEATTGKLLALLVAVFAFGLLGGGLVELAMTEDAEDDATEPAPDDSPSGMSNRASEHSSPRTSSGVPERPTKRAAAPPEKTSRD